MNDSPDTLKTLRQEVETLKGKLAEMQKHLNETEETLQAIGSGEIDALVVSTQQGKRVFLLEGVDYVYQCLVEQMGEGAATISADGLILYSNQQLSELLNCPSKNLIGSRLETFVSPQDKKAFLLLLQQLQEQKTLSQELSLIPATKNQEIAVKLSLKQFRVNEVLVNSVIITDLTELKVEAAKLNNILDRAIAAIISYRAFPDHTWIFDYWSQGCEQLFGYTAAELIADQNLFTSRIFPEDLETVISQTFKDYKLNKTGYIEYRYRHKNGTVHWILSSQLFEWDETDNCWNVTGFLVDITQRKQAEIALQEAQTIIKQQEEQLRLALELSETGIWDWYPTTGALYWNDCHYTVLGYQPGEVPAIYQSWRDRVHPDDLIEVEQKIQQAQVTHSDYAVEYRVIHPDSTIHWVLAKGRSLYDQAGQAIRMMGTIVDITDRKQAEIARREEQEKLRLFIKYAPVCVAMFDRQMCYLAASQRWIEMNQLGSWEAIIGRSHYELFPDLPERSKQVHQECLAGATRKSDEDSYIRFDGSLQWLKWENLPWRLDTGEVGGILMFAEDINDRKQAQQKIIEQATLIDITTDAIFVQDLDNQILFWSKGAERLYGWTEAEVLGQKTPTLFNQVNEITEALQTIIEQGSYQGELEQITKEGAKIIVESRRTLIENQFSQHQSILVVNSDITKKKQLEKQFYHIQRLESLGTLASGISHDFNNILTPILATSQLLILKFPNLDDQTKKLLTLLSDSAKRGADLVKQILLFSRDTEGQSVVLQLSYLLLELIGITQQTFPKSITISAKIPTSELWTISADATQIHQVFMNLLVNARDAMSEGGTLTITAENCQIDQYYTQMNLEAKVGAYVMVTVADTGIGIPPDLLERIFDPFFTTKEVNKGTGLGLSTVIGIVKNHGGFIKVYSQLGKGTEFKVFFSAIDGEVSVTTEKEELPRGKGELILIVDDEVSIREINKTYLENYNYRVILASDGIEALDLYGKHQQEISVVLMNMMMPNLDGMAAIHILKSMNPLVKIIGTSGLITNSQLALEADVQTFLAKPYTIKQLLQILQEILSSDNDKREGIPTIISEDPSPRLTVELSKEDLAIMPPEWLQQMYDAAYYCDEDFLLELIEQIPVSQEAIAHTLKDLVMDFNMDLIMELTK